MKCAYLLVAATAAFVMCEPKTSNNDVIWFPVDNEDGVFVSIYGEKHRTPSDSKWRNHRRVARYSGMEDYPSYIPPPDNVDTSFFHNIHNRRRFRQQNGFQGYPPLESFRPFQNSQQNAELISFDGNGFPQRPDYEGLDYGNLQDIIDDVFKNPSQGFPGQRPIPQNRPTDSSQWFTTTTTTTIRPPFQRPTTSDWFINPNPLQRPGIVRPNRPNRPNSESLVFPGETAKVTSTTPPPSTTNLVPTETTTLTPCERMCPVTQEFNPVCGTDMFNYTNLSRLKCAKACGKAVELSHFGQCRRVRTAKARPQQQQQQQEQLTLLRVLGL